MKIAFTGGRDYKDLNKVLLIVRTCHSENEFLVGDCPTGLDKLVAECLIDTELGTYNYLNEQTNVTVFKADWNKHGKAAGPIRNGEMLKDADMLIAFPGGRGTEDCIRQAKKKGIPVLRVE